MHVLLSRWFHVCGFVYGVPLTALDGVSEDLVSTLDALEETVVLIGLACGGFLVGMMAEHLFAVSFLDLFVGGFVAVFGEAENGVVVLSL